MPVRLYPLRTGSVRNKAAQCARKPEGAFRVLTVSEWSERLPIYSWLIDHQEGVIVVGRAGKIDHP